MGGGGSIQNMRNTLANNKDLLRKKKNPFKKKWGYAALRDQYRADEGTFQFRHASPEDREAIRAKILRERKTEKKLILLLILSLLFAIGVIGWFVLQPDPIIDSPQITNQSSESTVPLVNTAQYTYFMHAGDQWMTEQNWYNAVFEYRKAIEIYPNIEAYHRLMLAYLYECQQNGESCSESHRLINQMIASQPERADFYELRAMYFLNQGDTTAAELDFKRADQIVE